MDAKQRKLFDVYFQQRVERDSAFSIGDKLSLVRKMYQEAAQDGAVPIAPNRVAKVRTDTPRVQAILAGKEVAIGGSQIQGAQTVKQRMAAMPIPLKLALIGVIAIVPVVLMLVAGQAADQTPETTATVTLTGTATSTATKTATAGPVRPSATPYDMVLDSAGAPSGPHDPVSVAFASIAFSLKQAKLADGEWRPAVAEWLPGTELRRVVAVPYTQEVGDAVAGLTFGDEITLRLRSGEVVPYLLVDIQRVQRYEIEIMNSLRPSLVVILHGERSGERWVLVAEAVQGQGLPAQTATPTLSPTLSPTPSLTPSLSPSLTATFSGTITATQTAAPSATATPSLTPTPTETQTPTNTATSTSTATPAFAFTPPVPVTEVFTETLTVENVAAGLQLSVGQCHQVSQVGASQGNFVVCKVVLTALRDHVIYSGDTLAITERSQVEQVPGWWPPPLSVIGGMGSGGMSAGGDTVSGRVAGEVSKNQSDPVLLWEQDGLRYVIILAEALEE